MQPGEVARLLLEAHFSKTRFIDVIEGFRLEMQLNYSGLMAKGAYKGWKNRKHRGRRKVGCFDFKIFHRNGDNLVPLVHPRVISICQDKLNLDMVDSVFEGKDPSILNGDRDQLKAAQAIQLTMLEQEINWGDEKFQCWTLFPPSQGKRPRDFVTAYLRRSLMEPGFLENVARMRAASGTRGVLPPPKNKKEWEPYLEPADSDENPWLHGRLLERFREAAKSMPDNPNYASAYPQGSAGRQDGRD
jgi:hypothetical protein